MRLLVLDHSGILPWLVERSVSPEVAVEAVSTLEEAERVVQERPPDAAVVSMPHGQLPWARFQHLCATRTPPVPVLYESCVHNTVEEAGIDPADGAALFLRSPAPKARLREALAQLLTLSTRLTARP